MERSIKQELFYLENFFRFSNCNNYSWDLYFEDVLENYSEDDIIIFIESIIENSLYDKDSLFMDVPYDKIGEKTIEHFPDLIDWDQAACYSKLSREFIIKHKDKIDFDLLKCNDNIPEDLKTLIEII